jgi:hypothetical protein
MKDLYNTSPYSSIECSSVLLEKVKYAIQQRFGDIEFRGNLSLEEYRDLMIYELVAEVLAEKKAEIIPIDFSWFTYGDYKNPITDIDSYIKFLHHGSYKEHKLTRYIDLNQYIIYPSLDPRSFENARNTIYKCNWNIDPKQYEDRKL